MPRRVRARGPVKHRHQTPARVACASRAGLPGGSGFFREPALALPLALALLRARVLRGAGLVGLVLRLGLLVAGGAGRLALAPAAVAALGLGLAQLAGLLRGRP